MKKENCICPFDEATVREIGHWINYFNNKQNE